MRVSILAFRPRLSRREWMNAKTDLWGPDNEEIYVRISAVRIR